MDPGFDPDVVTRYKRPEQKLHPWSWVGGWCRGWPLAWSRQAHQAPEPKLAGNSLPDPGISELPGSDGHANGKSLTPLANFSEGTTAAEACQG